MRILHVLSIFMLFCFLYGYGQEHDIIPHQLSAINDIYQIENGLRLTKVIPERDSLPEDSSVVYFGYTTSEIVIRVRNWQKDGINANSRRRDAVGILRQEEDAVFVLLGSNGIGKDSYWIGINPLGTIVDRVVSDRGDFEWDGDIRSKAKRTANGWEVLVIIPFSTISYIESDWGIQIMRYISKTGEIQLLRPTSFSNLLQEVDKLKIDFSYLSNKKDYSIFIIPSFRVESQNGYGDDKDFKLSAGATMRFKKGNNDLFDLTIKPDFSEVDVDIQEFSLDRLPINYPEKRPYFIEGSSLMQTPVTLLRTRNILQPDYGVKFYSNYEKGSYIFHFVNDTALNRFAYGRFNYNPKKTTNIGTSIFVNELNYNQASFDVTHYLEPLQANVQMQISSVLDLHSNLIFFSFYKEKKPGIRVSFDFMSIDSNFVSPFNNTALNFDGIYSTYSLVSYSYYKDLKGKNLSLSAGGYFYYIVNKYDKNNLYKNMSIYFRGGLDQYYCSILLSRSNYDFLGLPDNSRQTLSINGGYAISSWNSFNIGYTFGDYLGGNLKQIDAEWKISFFNSKANLGFYGYKIKSPYDDIDVLQAFSEFQLFTKGLMIKPYLSYENDRLSSLKGLNFNFIILYEPNYLSGIYLAMNRNYVGNNRFDLLKRREIFKFNFGYKF